MEPLTTEEKKQLALLLYAGACAIELPQAIEEARILAGRIGIEDEYTERVNHYREHLISSKLKN
jgi:hypothetical protein